MDADDKHDFESVGADVGHASQLIFFSFTSAHHDKSKTHNSSGNSFSFPGATVKEH